MIKPKASESGQTIIETLAAIFILTTALVVGLGLAIYVLSNANINQNQIVATNLAREGIEIVRKIRDTNWLEDDASNQSANNLQLCADIGKWCYPKWLSSSGAGGQGKALDPGTYGISYNDNAPHWTFKNNDFTLEFDPSTGIYGKTTGQPSNYYRKIKIDTSNISAPYTNKNPEVIVTAIVGWTGKNCTNGGTDPETFSKGCKVVIEEHLTNWKDYQ